MNKTTRFILLITILALCFFIGGSVEFSHSELTDKLKQYPLVFSSFIFVILYIVVTFFVWVVAKDVFRLVSALVFGPYISALLIYLGEMCNAFILFHFSRKLGQDFVVQQFGIKEDKLKGGK